MNQMPFQPPRHGFTLTELLLAFLVVGFLLLPIFTSLGHAVAESDRLFTEAFAITHAKGVMGTLMTQVPFRCMQAGNPGVLGDPKDKLSGFLAQAAGRMFESGFEMPGNKRRFLANGQMADGKGFIYRIRAKIIDIDDVNFDVDGRVFNPTDLVEKDPGSGRAVVMKKIILEICWSMKKNQDPITDPRARKIFLVGIKSDLES